MQKDWSIKELTWSGLVNERLRTGTAMSAQMSLENHVQVCNRVAHRRPSSNAASREPEKIREFMIINSLYALKTLYADLHITTSD